MVMTLSYTLWSRISRGPSKQEGLKISHDEISGRVRVGSEKEEGVGSLDLLCNNQHKYKIPQLISPKANAFRNLAIYISFINWVTQQKY